MSRGTTSWRALGTYVYLGVSETSALAAAVPIATRVLAGVDRACSRFRPDSDLSRANRRCGSWVDVDPLLVAAVRVALEAAEFTGGLVDPCLGRTLVSLGYDADFATLTPQPGRVVTPPRAEAWTEVEVREQAVRVPAGCALDLGATAKAWAADLVALSVVAELGCGVIISLGGDLRVIDSDPWPVLVKERPDDEGGELVELAEGGLATSSTTVRRWRAGDVERHHLLDPRTGRPVAGRVRTVTTTGHTSAAANTASTAAIVLGDEADAWLDALGTPARIVASDGVVRRVGRWPEPILVEPVLDVVA